MKRVSKSEGANVVRVQHVVAVGFRCEEPGRMVRRRVSFREGITSRYTKHHMRHRADRSGIFFLTLSMRQYLLNINLGALS